MSPKMKDRVAIVVFLAVALAGVDLLVKSVLPTAPLFFHRRSGEWMILSAVVLVVALLLTRLPSRLLAGSAGLLAAGVLGNLVSARLHRGLVPNPFVIVRGDLELAFNLADLSCSAASSCLPSRCCASPCAIGICCRSRRSRCGSSDASARSLLRAELRGNSGVSWATPLSSRRRLLLSAAYRTASPGLAQTPP